VSRSFCSISSTTFSLLESVCNISMSGTAYTMRRVHRGRFKRQTASRHQKEKERRRVAP
jgi:hypothetical protein